MKKISYDDHTVFANALADVFIPELLSEDLPDVQCVFSPEFEKKMEKLIKRRQKPYYDLISTTGRRAACITAAVLIAGGATMSVEAVREKMIELAIKHFSGHDVIRAVTDEKENYPEKIEQEYTIDVPEGFVYEESLSVRTPECIISSYKSSSNYILFHQYTVSGFSSKINVKTAETMYYTDDNGILYTIYYWSRNEDNCDVIWQKNGYVFQLNSDLSKDEVIELCTNLKTCKRKE